MPKLSSPSSPSPSKDMDRKITTSSSSSSSENAQKGQVTSFSSKNAGTAVSARNSIDILNKSPPPTLPPPSPLTLTMSEMKCPPPDGASVVEQRAMSASVTSSIDIGEEHLHTFSLIGAAIHMSKLHMANFNLSRFLWFATHLFVAKTIVHHHHQYQYHQRSEVHALRSYVMGDAFIRHHAVNANVVPSRVDNNSIHYDSYYANDIKFLLTQIQEQEDELLSQDSDSSADGDSTNIDAYSSAIEQQIHRQDYGKSTKNIYVNDIKYLLSEIEEQENELLLRRKRAVGMNSK